MADLEKCILISLKLLSPTDNSLQQQAYETLEALKSSPDAWKYGLELLISSSLSQYDQVRFFALQLIESSLINQSIGLDKWFESIVKPLLHLIENNLTSYQPYLRNKFAQIFCIIIIELYPKSQWSFDLLYDMRERHKSELSFAAFILYVFLFLTEEISSPLLQRSSEVHLKHNLVKDVIRSRDIARLVEKISTEYLVLDVELRRLSFCLLAKLASWTDLSLITNHVIIMELYQSSSAPGVLQKDSIDCLTEIVSKGMSPSDKCRLIDQLGIISHATTNIVTKSEEEICALSKLLNAIGVEIAYCHDTIPESHQITYSMIESLLAKVLQCFGHEDRNVSFPVFPFISNYLQLVKKASQKIPEFSSSPNLQATLKALLDAIISKMMYSPGEYDEEVTDSDDDSLLSNLRKNYLKPMFEQVLLLGKEQNLIFVQEAIFSIFARVSTIKNFAEVEVALYLTLLLSEKNYFGLCRGLASSSKDINTLDLSQRDEPMRKIIECMIKAEVVTFDHPAVRLQYFENIVRFGNSGFFQCYKGELDSPFVRLPLAAFLDSRGIHCSDEAIRPRVWYLFLRWIRYGRIDVNHGIEFILQSMWDLLTVPPPIENPSTNAKTLTKIGKVSTDASIESPQVQSACNLYEVAGYLMGNCREGVEKQSVYISALLEPLTHDIKASLKGNPSIQHLADIIVLAGAFFKGLPDVREGSPGYSAKFQEFVASVIEVLQGFGADERIRVASVSLFTRMIGSLNEMVYPFLEPLLVYVSGHFRTSHEMGDLVRFSQLCFHRFQDKMKMACNGMYCPFLVQTFRLLEDLLKSASLGSDDQRSTQELQRGLLTWLQTCFTVGFGDVFIWNDGNVRATQTLLEHIINSQIFCHDFSEASVQKQSFALLAKMTMTWLVEGAAAANATTRTPFTGWANLYANFVREQLMFVLFNVPLDPRFNLDDAQCAGTLQEICVILKHWSGTSKDSNMQYLETVFFRRYFVDGSIWYCDEAIFREFKEALQQMDVKQFKVVFRNFCKGITATSKTKKERLIK